MNFLWSKLFVIQKAKKLEYAKFSVKVVTYSLIRETNQYNRTKRVWLIKRIKQMTQCHVCMWCDMIQRKERCLICAKSLHVNKFHIGCYVTVGVTSVLEAVRFHDVFMFSLQEVLSHFCFGL